MFRRLFLVLVVLTVIPTYCLGAVTVSGTIYQKNSQGQVTQAPDAWVDIMDISRENIVVSSKTGIDGRFVINIDNWQDNTYIIRASKSRYTSYFGAATLKNGSPMPFCATLVWSDNQPSIEYTYVPSYGIWGDPLRGKVSNVVPCHTKTITYIKVGSGWWVKPYWDYPFTYIANDGTFELSVTTGGIDEQATEYRTWLVTEDYENDAHTLPIEPPTEQILAVVGFTR